MKKKLIIESLKESLPPLIFRKEIQKVLGGFISRRTMANLDSAGLGPKGRVRIGRLVCYERDSLVSWLNERMSDIDVD